MKKRMLCLVLALVLCLALAPGAAAQGTAESYGYQQLSEDGKEIYNKLREKVADLCAGRSVQINKTFSGERAGLSYYKSLPSALTTFLDDYPEYFWLTQDYTYGYSYRDSNWTFHMECERGEPWKSGDRSVEEDQIAVEAQVAALVAGALEQGEGRYEQLLYVHDWLTANNLYNSAALAAGAESYGSRVPWTAVGALSPEESPVCEGYAKAFKLLCDRLGIPCVLISGTTDRGEHMWNAVQMEDGCWYAVDVTWDDPIYTFNGVEQNTLVSGKERHDYFLAGSSGMTDHTEQGDRLYPTLSVEKYVHEAPEETGSPEEPEPPTVDFAADSDFVIEDGVLTKYNGSGGDVVIPDGVTSIGRDAFWHCDRLTSITIPDSVTSIGGNAFRDCTRLTSITIPDSVTSIGFEAFCNCTRLTSVTIPDRVISIGPKAFYLSGLRSVTLSPRMTSIPRYAFYYCVDLTSITIPSSVTSIGEYAFKGCTRLTDVYYCGTEAKWKEVSIAGSNDPLLKATIHYNSPGPTVDSDFIIESGVLTWYGGRGGDVVIPDDVTSIGKSVFARCAGLTSVTIPNSVTSIGESAFASCAGLTSVTIPNSVISIGKSAFSWCTSLTSVTIPDSATSIGNGAFYWCTSLTAVTIPASVTSIGDGAFGNCTALTDVYYGGTGEQWEAVSIGFMNDLLETAAIHYNSVMPTVPTIVSTGVDPELTGTSNQQTQKVLVDGKVMEFQMYSLSGAGGVTNYIKLRDLADALNGSAAQFNVTWSKAAGVGLETGAAYVPNGTENKTNYSGPQSYQKGNPTTDVNGVAVPLQCFALKNGAYTYYKLRDLGQALGFNVGYDKTAKMAFIETNKPYDGKDR